MQLQQSEARTAAQGAQGPAYNIIKTGKIKIGIQIVYGVQEGSFFPGDTVVRVQGVLQAHLLALVLLVLGLVLEAHTDNLLFNLLKVVLGGREEDLPCFFLASFARCDQPAVCAKVFLGPAGAAERRKEQLQGKNIRVSVIAKGNCVKFPVVPDQLQNCLKLGQALKHN